MTSERPIILYHYKFSPYARRIQWYLALRGIPYAECLQAPIMPRPDIAALGVSYRRIPILSIGRDIYLDTRLQLSKLEDCEKLASLAPPLSPTSSASPENTLITRLLEKWCVDAGLFSVGASLMPQDLPALKDPRFAKDRAEFLSLGGGPAPQQKLTREELAQASLVKRAESLEEIRSCFGMLEAHLADGRPWILKGSENPTMADIESVWLPHWLILGLPGALSAPSPATGKSEPYITPTQFPHIFSWLERFDSLIKSKAFKPGRVDGKAARDTVAKSDWNEDPAAACGIDQNDALVQVLGLAKGDKVEVNPTDTGRNHKDTGELVGMSGDEIVWETRTKEGEVVRVHAPRHGFKVRKASAEAKGKL